LSRLSGSAKKRRHSDMHMSSAEPFVGVKSSDGKNSEDNVGASSEYDSEEERE